MATSADLPDWQSLTRILITALGCSEDLGRRFEQIKRENESLKLQLQQQALDLSPRIERSKFIEELRLENESLKQQLEKMKQAPATSSQINQLFQENVEKQAQIEQLKTKLRLVRSKEHNWRLKDISSPVVLSDERPDRKRPRTNSPPLNLIPRQDTPVESYTTPKPDDSGRDHLQNLLKAPPAVDCLIPRQSTADPDMTPRLPQFHSLKPRPAAGPENAEPFRLRPLSRLNLSHFKVNPRQYLEHNWAFNEVVRKKEARKCLPGCTNPECCGAMFKAIAASLPRGPADTTDEELLVEFMGPGSELKIQSLTPLARKNLIDEARTKKIANSYGKIHRSAFERPKTPPDFWDVDVLGSQEEQESRERAKLQEREEVEKRHREALRGDGRWVFADEG